MRNGRLASGEGRKRSPDLSPMAPLAWDWIAPGQPDRNDRRRAPARYRWVWFPPGRRSAGKPYRFHRPRQVACTPPSLPPRLPRWVDRGSFICQGGVHPRRSVRAPWFGPLLGSLGLSVSTLAMAPPSPRWVVFLSRLCQAGTSGERNLQRVRPLWSGRFLFHRCRGRRRFGLTENP